jgi:hypothetical protein
MNKLFKSLLDRSVFIDFEFRNVTSEFVDLVCCTTEYRGEVKEWWLYRSFETQTQLFHYLQSLKNEFIVGYSTVAEARSFMSLSLQPLDFKWIDLFLEYRCLSNHNDRLNYGKQLKDGKVINAVKPPPKWERTEEDNFTSFRPTHSLAEATYKLTGKIRDTDHKNAMRDLIISGEEFSKEDEIAIQKYCTEDVIFLKAILEAEIKQYEALEVLINTELIKEMLQRGRYSAITALMESWGYPINYDATKNFSDSVGPILDECQREINGLFPEIKPFSWNKKDQKFTWNQKATRQWLEKNVDVSRWTKTDTGSLSLSLEAWQKVFDYKHNYPKDSFGAQIVRYLKLKQNLNGFMPNPKKRSFWDAVGPDKRVRPYMNIYGSQSSRSQPSSTSFLFLKPAWMRALCSPAPGKAIASFDYGSEEFLISALWAEDENMIESYRSGDVYLNYAKLVGAVPEDGTKEQYKAERNTFKAILLGLSYLMSKYGLAVHLTNNTGRQWSEDEAQVEIDKFQKTFRALTKKQEEIQKEYYVEGKLKLPCGWYMFGDNDNFRSVCNVPIQGLGASIMRKAVDLAVSRGLKVIITLHDALYIEYDSFDFKAIDTLHDCMKEAFISFFDDKESASLIRLDGYSWSSDYPEIKKDEKGGRSFSEIKTPMGLDIEIGNQYLDERAIKEFEQFSKYFNVREEGLL